MPVPSNYPEEYEDQEEQVLAQIAARRKAFMQKAGQAEEQYVKKGPSGANLLGDRYNDPGDGDDLFKGNILD
jgi:hypothetical protein